MIPEISTVSCFARIAFGCSIEILIVSYYGVEGAICLVFCSVNRIYNDLLVPGSTEDSSLPIYSSPMEWKESPLHTKFRAFVFPEGFGKHCSIGLIKVCIVL